MKNLRHDEDTALLKGRFTGMLGFTLIWIGQAFSLLGTSMTSFALTVWAWQTTGQATALSLVGFFNFLPLLLTTPIAGVIVDRSNRKRVMIMSDLAAGLPTVAILLLYVSGNLQIWHLYITGAIMGVFQAFHFPAYSAATTMMIPKEQYARASGMLATAEAAAGIFAPIGAAILMGFTGILGVFVTDMLTLTMAISMLLFVRVPQPSLTEAGHKGVGSIWSESLYGFKYIFQRPSLLGLQLILFFNNLLSSCGMVLFSPMVLSRTQNDTIILGSVMSVGGIGGLAGGLTLTIWGGPKRRIHGVLIGNLLISLLGWFIVGLGNSWYVWSLAAFLGFFFMPILNGANQAIWQSKVPPDVQGRVFASRRFIAQVSMPLGTLLGGPLADWFFEPAMMPGGTLTPIFGGLIGTGPGVGMSLMLMLIGVLGVFTSLAGYSFHAIRKAEDILPDYGVETKSLT